jgi:uncharacterized protein (DUF2235 family)
MTGMSRHLIFLIDGTRVSASSGDAFQTYSNVYELAYMLQLKDRSEDGRPQIVFYSSGIASQPGKRDYWSAATGSTLRAQILDQYTNLCSNYNFDAHDGGAVKDKIYFFGFSRGAMSARALAALVMTYGLLRPHEIRYAPLVVAAWEEGQPQPENYELVPVDIEFIGAFDSVMGGVEWMSTFNPIRFPHYDLDSRCRTGVHILAIDENRRLFQNRSWDSHASEAGTLRQIWMPGVHSDIGGTGGAFWGRVSFLTMAYYIDTLTSLKLHEDFIRIKAGKYAADLKNRTFEIRQHRLPPLFSTVRTPWKRQEAEERLHPIVDLLGENFRYNGRSNYPWKQSRLRKQYPDVAIDDDLRGYFRSLSQ